MYRSVLMYCMNKNELKMRLSSERETSICHTVCYDINVMIKYTYKKNIININNTPSPERKHKYIHALFYRSFEPGLHNDAITLYFLSIMSHSF